MTPLRQRMIEDLQLRGYSERTVRAYVHPVAQLAQFYHTSPHQLTEEQVRQYLVHLSTVRKVARSTHALCGIKFFYQQVLGHEWHVLAERVREHCLTRIAQLQVARIFGKDVVRIFGTHTDMTKLVRVRKVLAIPRHQKVAAVVRGQSEVQGISQGVLRHYAVADVRLDDFGDRGLTGSNGSEPRSASASAFFG